MRARRAAMAAIVVLASAPLPAQTPAPPRFRAERSIAVTAPGPQRLDIDVTLLAGGQPFTVTSRTSGPNVRQIAEGGLADLRLFGAGGVEVPYLVVPPPVTAPAVVTGSLLPVTSTDKPDAKTSGFEVDFGSLLLIDAFRMDGIPPPFLKRFMLEGSGDRQRWTQLVAQGTAFDLPADQLQRTAIEFAAGPYRYLRVTWDDTNSARVPPPRAAIARRVDRALPAPTMRAPVTFDRRPSEPGRSRFRLRLPGGHLPIVAFELSVNGGYLLRDARVLEARLSGSEAHPVLIGQARLRRTVRDTLAADALRIAVQSPAEPQLDLVIDDGDNPPLELTGVTAVFAELPWIYFEATAAGPITARYGDPRLTAPRYDLEAARTELPASVATAAWSPSPPVAIEDEPAPLPMAETGSALDVAAFSYVRPIAAGPAGLVTVPLDAAVLAHSSAHGLSFADVRVLDRAGMQIPYLVERRDEPLTVDVVLERKPLPANLMAGEARRTSYALQLPYERLPEARLVLTTRARVFSRPVVAGVVVPPDQRRRDARLQTLSTSTWVHADPGTPAPALTIDVPERLGGELVLIVDEGDNQSLPIEKATLLLPSYAVRLFRPADMPLRLVYGMKEPRQPRYDLALLAPQVMGRLATDVVAAAESAPATTAPAAQLVSPPVFWVFLGLAVTVLLVLVVRLVRHEAA